MQTQGAIDRWPALPFEGWRDTYDTLHLWTQVIGKVCLALTPRTNHFWNVAFQITERGFRTPLMRSGNTSFSVMFDFLEHRLDIDCADGSSLAMNLEPMTVAHFYQEVMDKLRSIGVEPHIWTLPTELPNPIRFEEDIVHHSYDPKMATAFWRVLLSIKPVFEEFRCGFIGKCSPVHFFWGSFDLAVTRFSGRRAPAKPEMGSIYAEAYSHEVISHGFWPGNDSVPQPVFYAYAAPEPPGFRETKMSPPESYYDESLREFFLPYDAVRSASSPERALTAFLQSTYDAGAKFGNWDRAALER